MTSLGRCPQTGGGVTPTLDWLLTFLAHQEERDAQLEERHEATMHMLCEAFSGRSRHTPPAEITEDIPVDGESAPVTQRTFSGARAKARAPEQMPADITLRDLSAWIRSWDDFAELEQLERFPVSQQRAMLRTHLTVEMRAVLQLAIGIDTDDASSVSDILDAIHGYVRSKRNVTLDRVALEERRQEEGETFDEYYIALREITNNADLCKVCIDDRLTTRIMSGIRGPEIRRKLLANTPPPSLQTTINICRSEESARNDELELVNIENDPTKVDKIRTNTANVNVASLDYRITLLPKATSVVVIVGKCVTNHVINAQPGEANVPLAKKWETGRHAVVKNNESMQQIRHPR